ncbi:MAG: AAA family ATPase, partial [Cetobacterium sp.]
MEEEIKELSIENYKGIQSLHLDNLSKVNILIGANNTKKTTVLEAIYIGKSYYSAFSGISAANSRDLLIQADSLSTMFYNLDTEKSIKIKTVTKEKLDKYEVIYSNYKEFLSQNNSNSNSKVGFQTLKNNEVVFSADIQVDLNGNLNIIDGAEKKIMNIVDYVSSR